YLEAERDLGRIAAGADIATLAPTLIGAAHLLFSDAASAAPASAAPDPAALARVIGTVIGSVLAGVTAVEGPDLVTDPEPPPASKPGTAPSLATLLSGMAAAEPPGAAMRAVREGLAAFLREVEPRVFTAQGTRQRELRRLLGWDDESLQRFIG